MPLDFDRTSGEILISVTETMAGMMIKDIIKKQTGMSRHVLREILMQGGVTRNGLPCFITNRVNAGDTIRIVFPEDDELKVAPEPVPLSILYEDPYLIVVDKQPGVVVHPTKGYPNGTLANGLAYHFETQGLACKIRPVHRLDRDTSGALVFAKTHFTHQTLSKEIKRRKMDRVYFAIVLGQVMDPVATIDKPIGHDPTHTTRRMIDPHTGKPSVTHYRVQQVFGDLATALELKLETGRTHQIRVHMASIGHPLLGDQLYGEGDPRLQTFPIPVMRHALHALRLSFQHPVTHEMMTFQSPLPDDLQTLLKELEEMTQKLR
jgi:23S rRNA pseudouridine1911/1915/1917 synthase